MDVDTALTRLGKYGRWQVLALVLLGWSGNSVLAISTFIVVFIGTLIITIKIQYNSIIELRTQKQFIRPMLHYKIIIYVQILQNDLGQGDSC